MGLPRSTVCGVSPFGCDNVGVVKAAILALLLVAAAQAARQAPCSLFKAKVSESFHLHNLVQFVA